MKTAVLFVLLSVSAIVSGQAKIHFETANNQFGMASFDLGKVKTTDGTIFRAEIPFTNTGNMPLIIDMVQSPVDNMVADWSKEPLKPGQSGVIKVSIIARISDHPYRKNLYIVSNSECEMHRDGIQLQVIFTE